jgi:hypothetical protein
MAAPSAASPGGSFVRAPRRTIETYGQYSLDGGVTWSGFVSGPRATAALDSLGNDNPSFRWRPW